jgi:cyclopropane-fatty-acyl-phospholipid synthase
MSLSVSCKNVTDTQAGDYGSEFSGLHNQFTPVAGIEVQNRSYSCKDLAVSKYSSLAVDRWLCRGMLKALGDPPFCLVLWDGEEITTSHEPAVARVFIGDRPTLRRLIIDPEFQFGEAYSQGRLEVDGDLLDFLDIFYRTRLRCRTASHPLRKIWTRLVHAGYSNSIAGARENIHRHYDIGNDFYQLWLDPRMIYSCAYFAREDMALPEAQLAKLDYVCRKLWLRPGETVVDIGGGWGGLAIHMARQYGVTVKAFNISRQQIEFARRRARAEGLDGQVEFINDDYRNITGRFDALVSLGMLEHVGKKHYRDFGRTADRCLAHHGRGLIQTIAQNQPSETNSWIRRRIFPGGYAPTLRQMTDIVEPFGFSVLDLENLCPHYAKTLGLWLKRFESSAGSVEKMFDAKFVRMWRLYLSGSAAAFACGALQLFQFLFARPELNAVPNTRAHLYLNSPW